jgi:hypothetical protein
MLLLLDLLLHSMNRIAIASTILYIIGPSKIVAILTNASTDGLFTRNPPLAASAPHTNKRG